MNWLLLRGLGREQRHWHDFPERLRAQVAPGQVVLLDLAGMGTERQRVPVPSVPWLARDVARRLLGSGADGSLLDAARPEPAWSVIGLSLGGMVALELCWLWSRRIAQAIIINSSGSISSPLSRLEPRALGGLTRALLTRDPAEREAHVLALTSELEPERRRQLAQRSAAFGGAPRRLALLSQLCAAARFYPPTPASVSAPLWFLGSRRDRLVSAACSRDLARRYAAPYLEHPWAGHDLPLDDPVWVCERLAEIHERSGRRAAANEAIGATQPA